MATSSSGKNKPKSGERGRTASIPNPRAEVVRLAENREKLQKNLDELEVQLANYEATYLKGSPFGNAVRGWRTHNHNPSDILTVNEKDKIFSLSSATWRKVLATKDASKKANSEDADTIAKTIDSSSSNLCQDDAKEVSSNSLHGSKDAIRACAEGERASEDTSGGGGRMATHSTRATRRPVAHNSQGAIPYHKPSTSRKRRKLEN